MKKISYKNPHCLLDFIPDKVDGKKVYNAHIDGEHSIYMTKEFVDALMRDNDGQRSVDCIEKNETDFLAQKEKDDFKGNILNQKIILDLPKNDQEPLNFGTLYLNPTKYNEKLEETLTIRPEKNFLLFSKGDGLVFKFTNNEIEARDFIIRDMNARGKTIIDIDAQDGKCDKIIIHALKNAFNAPNIYFSFKGLKSEDGQPVSISIRDFAVSTFLKDGQFYYPKIMGTALYSSDGAVGSRSDDLTKDFFIKSKEGIAIMDSHLLFEPDENNSDKNGFGIEAKRITLEKINCNIKGLLSVSKEIEVEINGERSYAEIANTKINGGLVYGKSRNAKSSSLHLINVDADLNNSYLDCLNSVELENVTIKNNSKVSLRNVNLYSSEVKGVFQLVGVNAYYTNFDNFYLDSTETNSLISFEVGQKDKERDSSLLNNFKNVNVYLKKNETFIAKGDNPLSFVNCDFTGDTFIETKCQKSNGIYKVSGVNSKFTDSSLTFSANNDSETTISNSEIKGEFICDSVKEITTSCLENVKLKSLAKVEGCYFKDYTYIDNEKETSLININSNDKKFSVSDTKMELL